MLLGQCVVSIKLMHVLTVEMFSTGAMFRSACRHATTGLANEARLNPKEILSLYIYQDQEICLQINLTNDEMRTTIEKSTFGESNVQG